MVFGRAEKEDFAKPYLFRAECKIYLGKGTVEEAIAHTKRILIVNMGKWRKHKVKSTEGSIGNKCSEVSERESCSQGSEECQK